MPYDRPMIFPTFDSTIFYDVACLSFVPSTSSLPTTLLIMVSTVASKSAFIIIVTFSWIVNLLRDWGLINNTATYTTNCLPYLF